MKYALEKIRPIMSEYIDQGYKEDEINLKNIDITENKLQAELKVEKYCMPQDGVYHFTIFHTSFWVCQLAIIYAHIDLGLTKKEAEVYAARFSVSCKKKINKTENINIIIDISKTEKRNHYFYLCKYSIEDDSFKGELLVAVPKL